MGYAWSGSCYESEALALDAFAVSIPQSSSGAINTFTVPPSGNGSGLVTWTISSQPLTGAAATIGSGTTQLGVCTYDSFTINQMPDLLFVLALIFAFFSGFKTGRTL